jgi:hypothetical protein
MLVDQALVETENPSMKVDLDPLFTQHDVNMLQIADRCDQCGAQAFAKVTFTENRTLLMCGHHLRRHLDVLMDRDKSPTVVAIDDYTKALESSGMTSANAL